MTGDEAKVLIERVRSSWSSRLDEDRAAEWARAMRRFDYDAARRAVEKLVLSEEFRPSIARFVSAVREAMGDDGKRRWVVWAWHLGKPPKSAEHYWPRDDNGNLEPYEWVDRVGVFDFRDDAAKAASDYRGRHMAATVEIEELIP